MSKAKTAEAPTIHGSVEYEVVECDSCEQEVAKEEANRYFTGELRRVSSWSYKDQISFEKDTLSQGYICDHCSDNPVKLSVGDSKIVSGSGNVLQTCIRSVLAVFIYPPRIVADEIQNMMGLDEYDRNATALLLLFLWSSLICILLASVVLALV